jgi:hypothetical protein
MTQTLAVLVPLSLAAFFIWQVFRNRMMIVLLPLIPLFGRSAFLDILGWVGPLHMTLPDLMFAAELVAWFWVRVQRPTGRPLPGGYLPVAVLALLGLCVVGAVTSIAQGYEVTKTLREFLNYSFTWFGFFLWVDILRRFTRDEAWQVVRAVVVVSVPLLALYCLSALGVHIYPWAPYFETTVGSSRLVRDFATLSPFVFWVVAYYVLRPDRGLYGSIGLMLAVAAIMLSFTRSLILALAAALTWYLLLVLLSPRRRAERLRRLLGIVSLCVASVLVLALISPAADTLLTSRMKSLRANGLSDENVAARIEKISQVDVVVQREGRWFGAGLLPAQVFLTPGPMYVRGVVLGDIMWARLYLNLGISGVLAVIAVLGGYLLTSLGCALSSDAEKRRVGAFQAMLAIGFILLTSVGGGFYGGSAALAMGLAMVFVEQRALWLRSSPVSEGLMAASSAGEPAASTIGASRF